MCLLLERGHTDVLNYDYELFMDMLQATEEVKKIEELRLAYILRVANHSENMDKDLAKLHHESYGKCITEKEVKKLNDLQKIGGI